MPLAHPPCFGSQGATGATKPPINEWSWVHRMQAHGTRWWYTGNWSCWRKKETPGLWLILAYLEVDQVVAAAQLRA